MASAQDVLNAVNGVNSRLDGVNTRIDGSNTRLDGVNSRVDGANSRLDDIKKKLDLVTQSLSNIDKTLNWGFGQLITIGNYTNQALLENAKQNDTIICILEHISRNTCAILNESHLQTGLQTTIKQNTTELAELFAATHAEAALIREREEALKKQIEQCCPPQVPAPPCDYSPCPAPPRLEDPPKVDSQRPAEHIN
jgi:chromosome segregation ATPase